MDTSCPVCLDEKMADPVMILACSHVICFSCICNLARANRITTCPCCRNPFIQVVTRLPPRMGEFPAARPGGACLRHMMAWREFCCNDTPVADIRRVTRQSIYTLGVNTIRAYANAIEGETGADVMRLLDQTVDLTGIVSGITKMLASLVS